MIALSICLSDLPKDKIKQAANGKKYINLILSERKEVGNYGETHTLAVSKTKEEREKGEPTVYVGSGQEWKRNDGISLEKIDEMPTVSSTDNDLPF